jgi:hypothetical protein
MPTGLIQHHDRVSTRADVRSNLVKVELHGFGVAGRQNKRGPGPALRAYSTKEVGGLSALVVRRSGTGAFPGPPICQFVLLANPHFILKPDLNRRSGSKPRADVRYLETEVFLNASTAVGSCL